MSLATRFLNLSMKEQICITIIALTLFCIGVILIVCCSLIYEILNKDYQQKKLYFFERYKQYIESVFYFQNFYLMQYEEMIHRMQKQTWRMQQSITIYQNFIPIQYYTEYVINMTEEHNYTDLELKNEKETPYFYIISFSGSNDILDYVNYFSYINYQTFANSIITHNIYEYFRMPGYNVPIIDDPLYYNLIFLSLFGFNSSKISNKIKELNNVTTEKRIHEKIFNETLFNKIQLMLYKTQFYMKYIKEKIDIFQQMYEKFYKEIISYSTEIFINEDTIQNYSQIFAGYVSGINYETNTVDIISTDTSQNYFYSELNTIPELLFFLNNNLTYSFDIDFIPLQWENNTIINKELCSIFKIKQKILSGNDFNYEEIYNDINKLHSNIFNCFIDSKLIEGQEEILDIFNLDFERFTEYTNQIYQGILNIIPENNNYHFYFIKYSFPNYNSLKEFQSEYLFFSQVNFYAFGSFTFIEKYVDHVKQVSLNIFFFIVMVIVYSWLVCLFINLMIFFKVIKDWTEPINKLQEAVESNNIKDDNIFKYEYDDIINELFLTCKELLTGQIGNNDNGFKNFNILEKDNDKKIDKNSYKKNLIINNEIMEELINKQQSMLDFSNNIKINEPNNINNISTIKKVKKSNISNDNLTKNIENGKKDNKENKTAHKAENSLENEPYIKLFKIAEYLDYYRSKIETNNVMLVSNNDYDESKMSKMLSKNDKSIHSSVSNQIKNKNDENNDNNYINMLDETNITYLWYMETKRKYRNFNYNVSDDYKELFTEFDDSYKNNQRPEFKKSISINKKEKLTGV